MKRARRFMDVIKEPFCGLSHGAGAILSVAALVVLLIAARGRPWHTVAFTIYGLSLLLLYTASTLYHSVRGGPALCDRLRRLDHSAIFLLIAGSYTPVCLVTLRGVWGWSLLSIVWALAFVGIALSMLGKTEPEWPRVTLYVIMGWLAMVAFAPLREALSPAGLGWLIAGGVVYSLGTLIFATDRPHLWPGRFSAHDLWHIFVLGGSACHFVVMLYFVAPAG